MANTQRCAHSLHALDRHDELFSGNADGDSDAMWLRHLFRDRHRLRLDSLI